MSGEKHENPQSEKQPVGRLKIEMQVEELEPIEAPSIYLNSNETQPAAIIASAKAIFGTSFETWKTGPLLRQVVALIVFDSSAEPALAGARKTGSRARRWGVSRGVVRRLMQSRGTGPCATIFD